MREVKGLFYGRNGKREGRTEKGKRRLERERGKGERSLLRISSFKFVFTKGG